MRQLLIIIALLGLLGAAPADQYVPPRVSSTRGVHFTTMDVHIDPGGSPLAAYQISFGGPKIVALVGIEGGDHPAFKDPPYYDPAALKNNGVILAAFNTGADLPKTSFRAARLHLQISGEQTPTCRVKLIVASDSDGKSIGKASATLQEGVEP